MAEGDIRRLFFSPPIAVARLGGSTAPLDAFDWGPGDPHTTAETRIHPAWTLTIASDGMVMPTMPTRLTLRDGLLLRPLAPFLELWAVVDDGAGGEETVPVTPELLAAQGAELGDLRFTVDAVNAKAARRTGDPDLRFGTFPPLEVDGDDHTRRVLEATSPPGATSPMIPAGRAIPLGAFQVCRPVEQPGPGLRPWPDDVRVDALRVRFTPARGRFYGPPRASALASPAVPASRAFLDPEAGWFRARRRDAANMTMPADTIDIVDEEFQLPPAQRDPRSLGVVDDTCDASIIATLTTVTGSFRCAARVAVAPPHYAPDRRPFLSVADELNDREHDPARDAAMTDDERAVWAEDLFERVFETVSLLDVDFWRANNGGPVRNPLPEPGIPGDAVEPARQAMGRRDPLRDRNIAIPAPSDLTPLPLSQRARERHRTLADAAVLAAWVREHPGRLRDLVRAPLVSGDSGQQSMEMPPFMRNSNAGALSLSRWQYDLLMAWAESVVADDDQATVDAIGADAEAAGGAGGLTTRAATRRAQVLDALTEEERA